MGSLSSINILFRADLTQFSSQMQNVTRTLKKQGEELQNLGKSLSLSLTLPLALLAGKSVDLYDTQAKAIAQVDAGLKSTNNQVGITSDSLQKMASELQNNSLFGDEDILKNVTAQLLTFTNIAQNQFARTQQAALDLATRLDGDLKSASIQLGKALNDPVANLSALSRSGIQFTVSQKEMIKSLTETGRLADAQNLILDELQKQYGGSAAAAAAAGAGGLKQLSNSLGDLLEDFGKIIIEAITPFVNALKELVTYFQSFSPETKKMIVAFAGIAAAIGPVLIGLGLLIKTLPIIATGFTLMTGPIGLAVIGVGALIALIVANWDDVNKALVDTANYFVDLYNESTFFRFGVESVILTFKTLYNTAVFVFEALKVGFKGLVAGIKVAVGIIGELISAVLTGRITSLPSIFADGMKKLILQQSKSLQQSREVFSKFGKNVGADFAKSAQNIIGRKKIALLPENVDTTALENKLEDAIVANVGKGMKRIKLEDLAAPTMIGTSGKTLAGYDEEIAKINEFIQTVATTPVQIATAKKAIESLEFQKTLLLDPTSLINVEGFNIRLKSMANSYSAFSSEMVDIGQIIFESVEQFKENLAGGFGELIANAVTGTEGIGGIFKGLLLIVADFMVQLGKSLIAVGVASDAFKAAFKNPYLALAAGIALVALGSIFKNTMQKGPQAFANGGIVGGTSTYGDKILARVNSKELILNQKQQKSLYGMINPAVSDGNMIANLVGQLTVKGNDLVLVMDRATQTKNRKG